MMKPDAPSADHAAMRPFWDKVDTILDGEDAVRAAGKKYLPKFPDEPEGRYKFRLGCAKFTNIFGDIVENLAQRPFGTEVQLVDGASTALAEFAEDVDGRGNHLHVFAGDMFFAGIAAGLDWVLVDYTRGVPENATRAEEARLGARPIWARYPAASVLEAKSAMVDGKEEFVRVRLYEPYEREDDEGVQTVERVRVLNREPLGDGVYGPATFQVLEKQKDDLGKEAWQEVDAGQISIGVIPLVPLITGRRKGRTWQIRPPMKAAADLQITLYRQESSLQYTKEMTAYPMLVGNGVMPELDASGSPKPVPVGPHCVLYAPPNGDGSTGSWTTVEPAATSTRVLMDDVATTKQDLRELGRQPLTAQSGNLTVVTTAYAAQKGNAAIQAWALNLKDALENALRFTAMWLKEADSAEVQIDTDFDLGWGEDDFGHVLSLRQTGDISRDATIQEAKRRNILSPEYDPTDDATALLWDLEDDDDADTADAGGAPGRMPL